MKLKGIKPLEHHIEKIVVGAAGLALLGVVGWQLLGESKVKVGDKEVALSEAFKPADDAASKLRRDIDDANPQLKGPGDAELKPLEGYASALSKPISPVKTIASLGSAVRLGAGPGGTPTGDATYAALVVPPPQHPVAASFRGTIDPNEKVANADLAALLPKEQPYDKAAVSIESSFSGLALKEALSLDPDGAGPKSPIRPEWWVGDQMAILAVEAEREQLMPDGTWGNSTPVDPMPGRINFLKQRWEPSFKGEQARGLTETLREASSGESAEQIQRPPFYRMIVGEWVKPSVAVDREERNIDMASIKLKSDQLKKLRDELATVETQLAALPSEDPKKPKEPAKREERPQPGVGGGGGGGKGGPGPNVAPTPTGPTVKPELSPEAKRRQLTTQKKDLERRIAVLEKEVQGAGEIVEKPAETAQNDNTPKIAKKLLDTDQVPLIVHDLKTTPGETYRYRLRVVVNNPFLGSDIVMKKDDPEQQALPKASSVVSAWSDWTPEVKIDRDGYWFITGASRDPVRQNAVTAKAEVYQFYYGYYRKAEVNLEPGDALIAEVKLPDLYTFDETKLDAQLTPAPTAQPDGGGGKTGGTRAPGGGRDEGQPGKTTGPAAPPANGVPAKSKLVFTDTANVLLLDVAPIATRSLVDNRGRETLAAVLRNFDGKVVIRAPEDDKERSEYKRVRNSSEAGALAARPKIDETVKPKPPRQPDGEPPRPPTLPPGGGGGGGGGG